MVGKYIAPSEIKKREPQPTAVLEALVCPKCSAPLTIRAIGVTTTLTCGSCDSLLDLVIKPNSDNSSLVLVEETTRKSQYKPAFPLGTRCKFHGATWEVIGFMVREEVIKESTKTEEDTDFSDITEWFSKDNAPHVWREYLLFNPYKGYRWLTEDGGHWNYFVPLHEQPHKDQIRSIFQFSDRYVYSGLSYKFNSEETAAVKYVNGEFYWRVRIGDQIQLTEYIHRPYLITKEKDRTHEVNWSFGEYLFPYQVREAFKESGSIDSIKIEEPVMADIADNQPIPLNAGDSIIYKIAAILVVSLLSLNFITSTIFPEKIVYETSLVTEPYKNAEVVSDTFEITSKFGGLGFRLEAPTLNNSWLSLDVELINEVSGETVYFETGTEFYSGWDDGSWSEGNKVSTKQIPSVPQGKYKLLTQVTTGSNTSKTQPIEYHIKLIQNHKDPGSIKMGLIFLLIFPLLLLGILIFYRYSKSLLSFAIWTIIIIFFILIEIM